MDRAAARHYRCPYTGEPLTLRESAAARDEVTAGVLVSASGREYPILDGLPHLISPTDDLYSAEQARGHAYYQATSGTYDAGMDWLFRSFHEDEAAVRERMVDRLELTPDSRVLETGCGTGRDSAHIAARLGPAGELFSQDLSAHMLAVGRSRLAELARDGAIACRTHCLVGNACHLPFADGSLDAAYHFGGLNVFADKRQALSEMARVVRPGGKVVAGDEGVAPWLRGTPHGDILINSNPLYRHTAPLDCLPGCAREVCVRWVLGGAFYLIDFRVGVGPPPLDLDLPIPGKRGGTHRTRYYGTLEGVSVEAKELSLKAADAAGVSVHEWLDRAVRRAAQGGTRC